MGGFFGVASKKDCVLELFYGVELSFITSEREEAEWLRMETESSAVRSII